MHCIDIPVWVFSHIACNNGCPLSSKVTMTSCLELLNMDSILAMLEDPPGPKNGITSIAYKCIWCWNGMKLNFINTTAHRHQRRNSRNTLPNKVARFSRYVLRNWFGVCIDTKSRPAPLWWNTTMVEQIESSWQVARSASNAWNTSNNQLLAEVEQPVVHYLSGVSAHIYMVYWQMIASV